MSHEKNIVMSVAAGVGAAAVLYLGYKAYADKQESKKSLFERVGGDAAVDAAVTLFYQKMLSDDRVKRFFVNTNMATQKGKQRAFLTYALGKPQSKYSGKNMAAAHRNLGLTDMHFDATAENLKNTLLELGVKKAVVNDVMAAVESMRDEVMCRGKWAQLTPEEMVKPTLYERLGGEKAIDVAVDAFYKKVLADERVNAFFKETNMAHQAKQQKKFLTTALGGPAIYTGRNMRDAHIKLVRNRGLSDIHFDAIAENLSNTLLEIGVPRDLKDEVIGVVATLRDEVLCRGKWA